MFIIFLVGGFWRILRWIWWAPWGDCSGHNMAQHITAKQRKQLPAELATFFCDVCVGAIEPGLIVA